ncbi:hypothetical protein ANN_25710 [Periplaneta americana]|uniref:Uncharacterized protein n=1 Tax=Periplaneta americana TaxID=6978 RepID=A0ABQ8S4A9_PERAM|nr:hypothetical protein ANN_25710 [Periplaneta americana]
MAGLCEGGNEPPGSLKANLHTEKNCSHTYVDPNMLNILAANLCNRGNLAWGKLLQNVDRSFLFSTVLFYCRTDATALVCANINTTQLLALPSSCDLTGSYVTTAASAGHCLRGSMTFVSRKKSILSRLRTSHNLRHIAQGQFRSPVVAFTADVQNVHLLLEYRPHNDVSWPCKHDPKFQDYCVFPHNLPQFDSEGIPSQAQETNTPMILNGPTSRNR